MALIRDIADRYVEQAARLDPVGATSAGLTGFDHLMTDLSPDGFAARAALDRATLAELEQAVAADGEQVARQAMIERLTVSGQLYESGATTSELNVIASWPQSVRQIFDLMPLDDAQDHSNLAARMAAVPAAYAALRSTYSDAAAQGRVTSRRQVAQCARQCADWTAAGADFYAGLVDRAGPTGAARAELDRAATAASAATAELGQFLQAELLPLASHRDAVGRERYALASRAFLGAEIDLDEAYAWGWAEVIRIEQEMRRVAAKIVPKFGGVYPLARRYTAPHAAFTTLLMSTGLTFGTITSLYGLQSGIIDQTQFSLLISVVVLSAIIPTAIAQRFYQPHAVAAETASSATEAGL